MDEMTRWFDEDYNDSEGPFCWCGHNEGAHDGGEFSGLCYGCKMQDWGDEDPDQPNPRHIFEEAR